MKHYAGFWIRGVAKILDESFLSVLSWVLQTAVEGAFPERAAPFLFFGSYLLVSTFYYVYAHAWYGTTLFKRLFKIYVIDQKSGKFMSLKQSLWRCVGYTIASLPFGAGFLMAAWHPEKKGLHDLMAGTVSVIR